MAGGRLLETIKDTITFARISPAPNHQIPENGILPPIVECKKIFEEDKDNLLETADNLTRIGETHYALTALRLARENGQISSPDYMLRAGKVFRNSAVAARRRVIKGSQVRRNFKQAVIDFRSARHFEKMAQAQRDYSNQSG